MKNCSRVAAKFLVVFLVFSIVFVFSGAGCKEPAAAQSEPGIIGTEIAATRVPDLNLDLYFYFQQEKPTAFPAALLLKYNVYLQSIALWGLADEAGVSYALAVEFDQADNAGLAYSRIKNQKTFWVKLSGTFLYIVNGSGASFEDLKTAIDNGNFKNYDDENALLEMDFMPLDQETRPAAVGVIKPTPEVIAKVKGFLDSETAQTLESIVSWGKPENIIMGLYCSEQLGLGDILDMAFGRGDSDLKYGAAISIISAYPAFIVEPAARRLLDERGYEKESLENLTVYRTGFDPSILDKMDLLINISGNHAYFTVSPSESFANFLMTGIRR